MGLVPAELRRTGYGAVGELTETVEGPRHLLTAVEWMLQHADPIDTRIWDEVYAIAMHARDRRARLRALAMLADRVDPLPSSPAALTSDRPVTLHVVVVNSERDPRHPPEGHSGGVRVRNSERGGA